VRSDAARLARKCDSIHMSKLMKSLSWTRLLFSLSCISSLGLSQSSLPPNRSSGIDLEAIDKSVDPCGDFYTYACGNWMKTNPIPPQYGIWGRFNELAEKNRETLRQIMEEAAKNASAPRGSDGWNVAMPQW